MRRTITFPARLLLLAAFAGVSIPAFALPALEWDVLYDGGGLYLDVGTLATTDPAGNLVVAGQSADAVRGVDMLVRKLDRDNADLLWERRISAAGDEENDLEVGGMAWDGEGNLLVGGTRQGCYG